MRHCSIHKILVRYLNFKVRYNIFAMVGMGQSHLSPGLIVGAVNYVVE